MWQSLQPISDTAQPSSLARSNVERRARRHEISPIIAPLGVGIAVRMLALILLCLPMGKTQAATQINPPLGPYINLAPADFADSTTFSTNDRIVATDYFYWYDVYSSAHIIDSDGSDALTDHPATMVDFSYTSEAWHRMQLTNMMDAGIDILLPVSWGAPSETDPAHSPNYWSFAGLTPLVAAREQLLAEGKQPPRIGMFYDTSSLLYNSANQHIDLTTDYGREWFYESIRDFFSLIPPKHWAMLDGRPVVFLYSSSFALAYDQTCIDFAKSSFARDFGGRIPYIVREVSWAVQADNVYQWGGAVGLKNPGVASLGPGYNDSAVLGRVPLIVSRDNGDFYRRNWTRFLQNPSFFAVVETWNEFHEGTDVADSREYGRTYIDLTRQYTDMFRQGIRPPFPRGAYTDVSSVSVALQTTNQEHGLYQFDSADGATASTNVSGSDCRGVVTTAYPGRYIYFRVDDSFKWSTSMELSIQVDYFDSSGGGFWIEFDGSDLSAPFQGAYSSSGVNVPLTGSGTWRTATFSLNGVKFLNSQNGGADFRIALSGTRLFVRSVKVIRPGVPIEAGQTVAGMQDEFSGAAAGPIWFSYGQTNTAFTETNGVLDVRSMPGGLGYFLLNTPVSTAGQEILARVRIRSIEPGYALPGGVASSVNTNDGSGMNFYLMSSSAGAKSVDLNDPFLPLQPARSFSWTTNRWYWMRLLHETNSSAGAADVSARIWPADGITPEPTAWLATWDYFPAFAERAGLAGIVAGGQGTAELEFDYFLLMAAGLPQITVRLPAHKPALTTLTARRDAATGLFSLQIQGEPGAWYRVETSTNLLNWQQLSNLKLTNGTATIPTLTTPTATSTFYRAAYLGSP